MNTFIFNNLYITKNAFHFDKLTSDAKELIKNTENSLSVFISTLFTEKEAAFFHETPNSKVILIGTDIRFNNELTPVDVRVLNPTTCFGSTQYLFDSLYDNKVPNKAIFRYVKDERFFSKNKCVQKTRMHFSSIIFSLNEFFGEIDKQYSKHFIGEDNYRFNSIINYANGSILFFEYKSSTTAIPNEYWEYCFKGGMIDHDGLRETPLLTTDSTMNELDSIRITGDENEVRIKLINLSTPCTTVISTKQNALQSLTNNIFSDVEVE